MLSAKVIRQKTRTTWYCFLKGAITVIVLTGQAFCNCFVLQINLCCIFGFFLTEMPSNWKKMTENNLFAERQVTAFLHLTTNIRQICLLNLAECKIFMAFNGSCIQSEVFANTIYFFIFLAQQTRNLPLCFCHISTLVRKNKFFLTFIFWKRI